MGNLCHSPFYSIWYCCFHPGGSDISARYVSLCSSGLALSGLFWIEKSCLSPTLFILSSSTYFPWLSPIPHSRATNRHMLANGLSFGFLTFSPSPFPTFFPCSASLESSWLRFPAHPVTLAVSILIFQPICCTFWFLQSYVSFPRDLIFSIS